MPTVRARLRIRGLVQGVFFRASTQARAEELGLSGSVRNESDGTVTAVVEGPRPTVESLVEWCHQGPPTARVDDVKVEYTDPEGEPPGFRITR